MPGNVIMYYYTIQIAQAPINIFENLNLISF